MSHPRAQDGSLPIAMLASIIIGGLVLTLVATTMLGQQQVRADRDFQTAINGADAAMQQAATVISQLPDGGPPACEAGTTFGVDCALSTDFLGLDGTLGDRQGFTWTATQVSPVRWEVRGRGLVDGVERVVEADVAQDAVFTVGAFADIGFTMRGSNFVRSYTASTSDNGNGSVGSNGPIVINGNSRADIINLFGPASSCSGSCGGSNTSTGSSEQYGFSDVFDIDAIEAAIVEAMEAACPIGAFRAYDAGSGEVLRGGETYCFTQITSDNRDEIVVEATSEDPAVVYVKDGDIRFENSMRVNCPEGTCGSATSRPDTGALQIYSTGRNVLFGNHGAFALALAAPQANCAGSPSNAQATIYGALLCNDLTNQGGWDFHFDERLANIGAGQFRVTNWREEAPGTTSFTGG